MKGFSDLTIRRQLMASAAAIVMIVNASPATAQGAPAGQGDQAEEAQAQDNPIGEIVVTARYVEESIQDTPIAITAQSSEQLEAANVTGIGSLGAVVPNLQTVPGDAQSSGTPRISLRGVQQGGSSSIAVPPAVAIYSDDVYHSTTAGSELDFTDVVRVEVNRGPQSTLSGNASIGGSIKIFTADPRGDGSGFVTLGYGSRDHIEAAGAVDVGLSSTLALRALGHFDKQRGYGDRLDFACMMDKLGTPALKGTIPYFKPAAAQTGCVIGHTGGGTRAVGQVKLLWTPVEDVSLLLTARYREEDLEDVAEVTLGYPAGCVRPVPGYPAGIGPQPCNAAAGTQVYHLATQNTFGVVLGPQFVTPARGGRHLRYLWHQLPSDPQQVGRGRHLDLPRGLSRRLLQRHRHLREAHPALGQIVRRAFRRDQHDRDRQLHRLQQQVHQGQRPVAARHGRVALRQSGHDVVLRASLRRQAPGRQAAVGIGGLRGADRRLSEQRAHFDQHLPVQQRARRQRVEVGLRAPRFQHHRRLARFGRRALRQERDLDHDQQSPGHLGPRAGGIQREALGLADLDRL
ncbi:MAG: TonB-dependent receptor [Sphingomonas sp.]